MTEITRYTVRQISTGLKLHVFETFGRCTIDVSPNDYIDKNGKPIPQDVVIEVTFPKKTLQQESNEMRARLGFPPIDATPE